jgi:hypothetical protein
VYVCVYVCLCVFVCVCVMRSGCVCVYVICVLIEKDVHRKIHHTIKGISYEIDAK